MHLFHVIYISSAVMIFCAMMFFLNDTWFKLRFKRKTCFFYDIHSCFFVMTSNSSVLNTELHHLFLSFRFDRRWNVFWFEEYGYDL